MRGTLAFLTVSLLAAVAWAERPYVSMTTSADGLGAVRRQPELSRVAVGRATGEKDERERREANPDHSASSSTPRWIDIVDRVSTATVAGL